MSIVDIDVLMQDQGAAPPCGPNLEYDPAFLELEKAVLGKPEVQYGTTITAAVPPEWKLVKKLALELMARSHDLRVALPLLRSLLVLHGMSGFSQGARLIERMVDERWDNVHPQLDPDDDLDPMLRINSLATLADPATVLRELKDSPFLQLPGLGPLSLRALEIASGELPAPEGQAALTLASIEAAMHDVDPEQTRSALAAASQACESIVNVEVALVRRVGSSQALNLDALIRNLRRMREFLASHVAPEAGEPGVSDGAAVAMGGPVEGGQRAAPAPASGEINSRADVIGMLDKILAYYARCEPSSPVPMLLERARRLAPKTFFEILEDLAPDSVGQVAVIRGPLQEQ